MIECTKCHKAAMSRIQVKRYNKYGTAYEYDRYVHYDRRKTSRRRYCYVRVEANV